MRLSLRRNASAYVVLVISLLATIIATRFAHDRQQEVDRNRFEESADRAVAAIEVRIDAYISALYAGSAMFRGSEAITPAEFRDFVAALELERRYPGIQGLGFARLLTPDEIDGYQRALRAAGIPNFRVWPREPERERYSAIAFLEPLDRRNQRAIGYDMLSEEVRREAMDRAARTGAPAASGKVTLVQEFGPDTDQSGFLIYLPILDGERQRGWVYAPFRSADLLHGIFPTTPRFEFRVFSAPDADPAALLFASGGSAPDDSPAFRTRRHMIVAGQPWTLSFRSSRAFFRDSSHVTRWVGGLGTLASLLLFAIARLRTRAAQLAQERQAKTTFLATAGRVLGESLDYEATLDRVAHLAVADLADWCVVHLREDDGSIRDVVVVHRDPTMSRFGAAFARRFPHDEEARSGVPNVIRTGKPELLSIVPEALLGLTAQDEEHRAVVQKLQVRSFMCVPLIARGTVVGAITFISAVPGRFTPAELAFAEELAQLAATAVDNARLYLRAQQAVRIRDEFLSVASHELKTPLTSMALKLETLKRHRAAADDDRQQRAREVLDRQVRRLTRLVDSLLDVSRIASGRLRLDLAEVDLAQVAREVVAGLQDELQASATRLEVEMPPSLVGRWDRLRTEQVLTNLLTNAVKYGRGNPVSLRVEDGGDWVRLIVRDRGIGISAADVNRIFERFERAVSVANYGGLGLGLYITRQIVEALGGRIRVESEEGEGSTFTVELPRFGAQPSPPGLERLPRSEESRAGP